MYFDEAGLSTNVGVTIVALLRVADLYLAKDRPFAGFLFSSKMLEFVSLDVDLAREQMEEFGEPPYTKTDRMIFKGVDSMKYRQRSLLKASIIGVEGSFIHPCG